MSPRLEVLFTPAEFEALAQRDLSQTVCVVFDVLRATSSMVTALVHGAAAVIPARDIPEALALRREHPDALLAGERHGLRISPEVSGGVEFDLGNSPREFGSEKVSGRTVIMTTTNGTRALSAAARAREVLVAAFLNLQATTAALARLEAGNLLLVCSGTYEEAALEDTLAAGALCSMLPDGWERADSAVIASQVFELWRGDLEGAMRHARNGRRLLSMPELADDVAFCVQRDVFDFVCELKNGSVRKRVSPAPI